MFVALALFALCFVGNAIAATVPLPEKIYYNLEDAENLYKEFLVKHKKSYESSEELARRFEIFKDNMRKVNELNSRHANTVFTIYHFADLFPEEMSNYYGLKRSNVSGTEEVEPQFPDGTLDPPPAAFDWRDKGVVTHVKDQNQCGSCYIFSAVGAIESQYALKHNQLIALSEQQALDCLKTKGCGGGFMDDVMEQLAKHEAGSLKEEDYPAYDHHMHQCREKPNQKGVKVLGAKVLRIKDEGVLLRALLKYGPLSVGIDASDLGTYSGGILHPVECKGEEDHGMLLVGYGEENGEKFWIIKNSWGEIWGEKGYVRLLRGVDACKMGTSFTAAAIVA